MPRRMIFLAAAIAAAALPVPAAAQSLMQVYQDAKAHDAQFAAARHALTAGLEKLPQGRALVLPTLNLSANTTSTRIDSEPRDGVLPAPFVRDARAYGYTLSFSQPIYRRQNFIQYDQAGYQAYQEAAAKAPFEGVKVLAMDDKLSLIHI